MYSWSRKTRKSCNETEDNDWSDLDPANPERLEH